MLHIRKFSLVTFFKCGHLKSVIFTVRRLCKIVQNHNFTLKYMIVVVNSFHGFTITRDGEINKINGMTVVTWSFPSLDSDWRTEKVPDRHMNRGMRFHRSASCA